MKNIFNTPLPPKKIKKAGIWCVTTLEPKQETRYFGSKKEALKHYEEKREELDR